MSEPKQSKLSIVEDRFFGAGLLAFNLAMLSILLAKPDLVTGPENPETWAAILLVAALPIHVLLSAMTLHKIEGRDISLGDFKVWVFVVGFLGTVGGFACMLGGIAPFLNFWFFGSAIVTGLVYAVCRGVKLI